MSVTRTFAQRDPRYPIPPAVEARVEFCYPNPDGLWIVEWVATRPEFRGRALIRRLLREILDLGREEGFQKAQIGYLLGNTRAKSAYEGVGFEWVEEHCHPAFEEDYGTPGIARMQRDL